MAAFETCLKKSNYRPRYLAVDEFAIHKGHRYATCVMDLETGFILWAGLGRSMADFEHFFKSIDLFASFQAKSGGHGYERIL